MWSVFPIYIVVRGTWLIRLLISIICVKKTWSGTFNVVNIKYLSGVDVQCIRWKEQTQPLVWYLILDIVNLLYVFNNYYHLSCICFLNVTLYIKMQIPHPQNSTSVDVVKEMFRDIYYTCVNLICGRCTLLHPWNFAHGVFANWRSSLTTVYI